MISKKQYIKGRDAVKAKGIAKKIIRDLKTALLLLDLGIANDKLHNLIKFKPS